MHVAWLTGYLRENMGEVIKKIISSMIHKVLQEHNTEINGGKRNLFSNCLTHCISNLHDYAIVPYGDT
jgi:hypothetical protein